MIENKEEIVYKKMEEFFSNDITSITYYKDIFLSSLKILFAKENSSKYKFYRNLNLFLRDSKEKEPIKNLLEYYNTLESLNHTQDLYQILIFLFNIYLCPEEKSKNLFPKII